jgi:hypothetical protein
MSAPSGFCRPAAGDGDRDKERRGLVTVDETERGDDGTGQDLKFSARHLRRQISAHRKELLSQNHTGYTSNILINNI